MTTYGYLALKWNNHNHVFANALNSLREKEKYTNVTLTVGEKLYQAHKIVLATCSEFFKEIFENGSFEAQHPIIFLNDVSTVEIESILDFMYKGVAQISQNELKGLLSVAKRLRVRGLAISENEDFEKVNENSENSDFEKSLSDFEKPFKNVEVEEKNTQVHKNSKRIDELEENEFKTPTKKLKSNFTESECLFENSKTSSKNKAIQKEKNEILNQNLSFPEAEKKINAKNDNENSDSTDIKTTPSHDSKTHETSIAHKKEKIDHQNSFSTILLNKFHYNLQCIEKDDSQTKLINELESAQEIETTEIAPSDIVENVPKSSEFDYAFENRSFFSASLDDKLKKSKKDRKVAQLNELDVENETDMVSRCHKSIEEKTKVDTKLFPCHESGKEKLKLDTKSEFSFESDIKDSNKDINLSLLNELNTEKMEIDMELLSKSLIIVKDTSECANKSKKPFMCAVCSHAFTRRDNLANHIKTHTGHRPYSCQYCHKHFSRKDYLKQHERIHTGEKPYACTLCEKAFTRKEGLTDHLRCHSEVKEFECDTCGKTFKQKCGLRFHKRNYKH